jgi:hypothetical protein
MLAFKKTAIGVFAAIFLTLACFSAQARPVMTIQCDEPNGERIDFYEGDFEEKQDGFAGVEPKFIFDDKKPQIATVILEPANLAKEMGLKASSTFNILVQNTDQITMISSTDKNIVQMYTLFPKKGIGYFTLHKYTATVREGEASTGTLVAKCNVITK